MAAMQMPREVEARIRALPGNRVCADCGNRNPQWASVTYGCLVCLECSGAHRSIGVHLSFVRSVAMDSWTDQQLRAMELSGGNEKLVQYFDSHGIEKGTKIREKYGSKHAEFYRKRLAVLARGEKVPGCEPSGRDEALAPGPARSTSCSTAASSGSSASPRGAGGFSFDDFDDWFGEACSATAKPRAPAQQQRALAAAPAAAPAARPEARRLAEGPRPAPASEEREVLAIKCMDLKAAPAKPRPRVEAPVGDDFFASFGLV